MSRDFCHRDRLFLRLMKLLTVTGLSVGLVIAVPVTVAVFGFHVPGRTVVDYLASWFR